VSKDDRLELSMDQNHDFVNQGEAEQEEDVKLMMEEENEEEEHTKPSLLVNEEKAKNPPITALQYNQPQHVEQGAVKHGTCPLPSTYQQETLHVFQDSFAGLLQSPEKEIFVSFASYGFQFCLESSFLTLLCLLSEGLSRVRWITQLLDWLY